MAAALESKGWVPAWHGTKLEALYAIAYHGILLENADEAQGERFLANGKGVYLHGDANRQKSAATVGLSSWFRTACTLQFIGKYALIANFA